MILLGGPASNDLEKEIALNVNPAILEIDPNISLLRVESKVFRDNTSFIKLQKLATEELKKTKLKSQSI